MIKITYTQKLKYGISLVKEIRASSNVEALAMIKQIKSTCPRVKISLSTK
jgi:hypothetical protein